MKYKLLKSLPGIKKGLIFEYHKDDTEGVKLIEGSTIKGLLDFIQAFGLNNKFFKSLPVEEEPKKEEPKKKTYDDLKVWDNVYRIDGYFGTISIGYYNPEFSLSNTFITRQEAEDEHARREWSVRKDRFIPNENECYFYPSIEGEVEFSHNDGYSTDYMMINAGLVFRTRQECQDAIDNHDIVRLFYTIR